MPGPTSNPTLQDRFTGCLLGLAIGDALGAHFEGQSPETLARRYRNAAELIANPPAGEWWYTDDTQMMIGVAETLVACGEIKEKTLCERFAANYLPQRGYGYGAKLVIEAIADGHDYKYLAANFFPGGSFGNGAAMRIAPVGLMCRDDHDLLWEQARLSSLPTHTHPLGIEGAQVLALAVAIASNLQQFDRTEFLETIAARCSSFQYSGPLRRAANIENPRDLGLFGNGIEAASSVVTAVASFALTPDSYESAVANAILLGGDTDTIAAMAGAISGAYLGRQAIPKNWVDRLEDNHQGRSYIESLAEQLFAVHKSV